MKNILMALLLTISTAVLAQNPQTLPTRTSITDDGATLTIQIDRLNNKNPIHYRQTFNVAGMNRVQKEWLKYQIFANKGVALPLHEMAGLGMAIIGLLALFCALLIVGYQTLKSRQIPQQTL